MAFPFPCKLVVVMLFTTTSADEEAHGDDGHDDHAHDNDHADVSRCPWRSEWEWVGVFSFKQAGIYTWSAQRKGGLYAAPSAKLLLLRVTDPALKGTDALDALDHDAHERWGATANESHENESAHHDDGSGNDAHANESHENESAHNDDDSHENESAQHDDGDDHETWKTAHARSVLSEGGSYVLSFDDSSWVTHFKVNISVPGRVAFFSEHIPTEFESVFHYFQTARGVDVEPEHEASMSLCEASTAKAASEEGSLDAWGEVIASSLVTVSPTLLGFMFVPVARNNQVVQFVKSISIGINSFGSGVLFGAAVFLLLPESIYMVGSAAQWGIAVLLGWFLGVVLDHFSVIAFSPRAISSADGEAATAEDGDNAGDMQSPPADLEADNKRVDSSSPSRSRHSLACSILIGDFFHNFSDGVVIAAAFKGCSHSFAWKIAAVTVVHELPQEIADFFILVNEVGMGPFLASVANFSCSMSTLLGAVITYASSMNAKVHGLFLAFGAGVFIFIAATELGPIVSRIDWAKPALASLQRSLSFVIGAAIIGLILLDHEHCELADESSDPHAGHGH
eukprot:TRINITY_DN13814_c1_g1_i2.p1 TRINITY_DN13814_c1_g1~~TRINITY_DN13814_c1_g1_i2.p1  ORF type:complete len:568 (+),score=82.98 TRINITY_DN13814_c1_g1_i2:67-1770(+)